MSLSFANVTTQNMDLSPCRITFGGVDLGGTLGNAVVKINYTKADIKADQSGETVRDRRVSGLMIQITTELAEVKLKDNWKVVFPSANLITSGGNKMIYSTSAIGDSDLAHALPLILHPLDRADADLAGDFKFFLACASAESEYIEGPKDQSKLKIVWNVLPDSTTSPERFFIYGDPSIGLVNATHGSPVDAGTGNGVMGSIAVYNGFTKTETITATCVTAAANGGVFNVNGSVSGPLGLATVGTPFISNPISFTIADGATDFIVGDTITITTTASNYS